MSRETERRRIGGVFGNNPAVCEEDKVVVSLDKVQLLPVAGLGRWEGGSAASYGYVFYNPVRFACRWGLEMKKRAEEPKEALRPFFPY